MKIHSVVQTLRVDCSKHKVINPQRLTILLIRICFRQNSKVFETSKMPFVIVEYQRKIENFWSMETFVLGLTGKLFLKRFEIR